MAIFIMSQRIYYDLWNRSVVSPLELKREVVLQTFTLQQRGLFCEKCKILQPFSKKVVYSNLVLHYRVGFAKLKVKNELSLSNVTIGVDWSNWMIEGDLCNTMFSKGSKELWMTTPHVDDNFLILCVCACAHILSFANSSHAWSFMYLI